ncbi:hypothetical protein Vretimale_1928 [Volvox reticuliferus]|uniref:Uncharacterized protein n=1 Tax=Volvox reticuliferus TaxID=1737510 RepID=A0A8J4FX13_9CHLO|nr:hypothetical protein Vretifemale_17300 [Volvox reticuliferus]GIL96021.1 hypothetical protein Vretimale_1928 [Volvox reticuliferus]
MPPLAGNAMATFHFWELLSLLDLEDLPEAAVAHLDCGGSHSTHMVHHMASSRAAGVSAAARTDLVVPAPGTPDPSEKDRESDDLVMELAPCSYHVPSISAMFL